MLYLRKRKNTNKSNLQRAYFLLFCSTIFIMSTNALAGEHRIVRYVTPQPAHAQSANPIPGVMQRQSISNAGISIHLLHFDTKAAHDHAMILLNNNSNVMYAEPDIKIKISHLERGNDSHHVAKDNKNTGQW